MSPDHACCSPGSDIHADEPVWEPLLDAVGDHLAGLFMWMYETRLANGTVVHAYKHQVTRAYLFLDDEGQAYEYTACRAYSPKRLDYAIEAALCFWFISGQMEPEDAEAIKVAHARANERSSRLP